MSTSKSAEELRGIDFRTHPNVLRMFRRHAAATWIVSFQEALWNEFAGQITVPPGNQSKLTLIGGGEMGYTLAREGLLDDFDITKTQRRIEERAGDTFHNSVDVVVGGIMKRRVKGRWQLATALDSPQLLADRFLATNAISDVAGAELYWRDLGSASLKIVDLNSYDGAIDIDKVEEIAAEVVPKVVVFSPLEIRRNDVEPQETSVAS